MSQKKDYVVTIKTSFGNMIAILYDETPKHKANFIKLAKEHYYDSLLFHRIIQGFMIQGGDPDSKKASPSQHLGNGGPDYTIEAEFNPNLFHEKGSLCAARTGDVLNPTKASSGSQFYIVQGRKVSEAEMVIDGDKMNKGLMTFFQNPENKDLKDSLSQIYYTGDHEAYQKKLMSIIPRIEKAIGSKVTKDVSPEKVKAYTTVGGTPHLDGSYTVFGKIIKGLDVIDAIASQPKDQADRPTTDIRMMVTVEELSKKKIEKLYGYKYPAKK
jgi:peptidyl-prolyl cis-trans isomerase B (cyclophilin B)